MFQMASNQRLTKGLTSSSSVSIDVEPFGAVPGTGEIANKYTFVVSSPDTMTKTPIATISSYGAALLNYYCPATTGTTTAVNVAEAAAKKDLPSVDADGKPLLPLSSDVIVSYETIDDFAEQPSGPFFGVTVGRYCNRIAHGKFSLAQPTTTAAAVSDGEGGQAEMVCYTLDKNNGPNHLHGGPTGYHHRNWAAAVIPDERALLQHMDAHGYFAASGTELGPLKGLGGGDGAGAGDNANIITGKVNDTTSGTAVPNVTFPCLAMSLISGDGEEGYPAAVSIGTLYSVERVAVPLAIGDADSSAEKGAAMTTTMVHRLRVDHLARLVPTIDDSEPKLSTVINLTNHAYFNLSAVDPVKGEAQHKGEVAVKAAADAAAAEEALRKSDGAVNPLQAEKYNAYIAKALGEEGVATAALTTNAESSDAAPASPSQPQKRRLPTVAVTDYPITGHHLALNAPYFTPTDPTAIPTGLIQAVAEVPSMDFYHDFKQNGGAVSASSSFFASGSLAAVPIGRKIGDKINDDSTDQVKWGCGYDHNWCLAPPPPSSSSSSSSVAGSASSSAVYRLAAVLTDPSISNRFLRVLTTQPGVQFYAGNFLDGTLVGKGGKAIPRRSGLCLETQHYPDSPNHANFPSTVLAPNTNFHETTVFELGNM